MSDYDDPDAEDISAGALQEEMLRILAYYKSSGTPPEDLLQACTGLAATLLVLLIQEHYLLPEDISTVMDLFFTNIREATLKVLEDEDRGEE